MPPYPTITNIPSIVTLYKTNASDLDVARAAWVSQNSEAHEKEAEEGRVEGLINFLWRSGHTSPFEHGSFTFVVHCPIFVSREFMRHRTFSFNEISGRYAKLPTEFYVPAPERPVQQIGKVGAYSFEPGSFEQQQEILHGLGYAYSQAAATYEHLLDIGVAKEVARMALPVSTMTTFWATANPLNVLKFLGLRTHPQALYEIRHVAAQMEALVAEAMPLTHAAWKAGQPA